MAIKTAGSKRPVKQFQLVGNIQFCKFEVEQDDLGVKHFAFDRLGEALGSGDVDGNGNFEIVVALAEPSDIRMMVGPGTDANSVR